MTVDSSVYEPSIKEYKNSVVMPVLYKGVENNIENGHLNNFFGGAYVDSTPIPEALLIRSFNSKDNRLYPEPYQVEHQAPYVEPSIEMKGGYIFCGILFPHFGHFFAESLARMWYAKKHPELTLVWTLSKEYSSWQKEVMEVLGIKNKAIFIQSPTRLESLTIPSRAHIFPHFFTPHYFETFRVLTPKEIIPGKKLYISKDSEQEGGYSNEYELEKFLQENGWIIYKPTRHPLKDRFDEFSSSEIILSIEASSFFSFLLFKQIKSKIFSLSRNDQKSHNSDMIFKDYFGNIAKNLSLNHIHLDLPKRFFKGKFTGVQYTLDIYVFKYLMQKTDFLSKNLEQLDKFRVPYQQDEEQAIQTFNLTKNFTNTTYQKAEEYYYISRLMYLNGDLDSAISQIKKSILEKNDNSITFFYLSELLIQKNDIYNAAKSLEIAIKLDKDELPNHHVQLGNLYQQQGRIDDCIQEVKKALSIEANRSDLYHYLANLYLVKGDLMSTESFLIKAIKIKPDFSEAYQQLLQVQQQISIMSREA